MLISCAFYQPKSLKLEELRSDGVISRIFEGNVIMIFKERLDVFGLTFLTIWREWVDQIVDVDDKCNDIWLVCIES